MVWNAHPQARRFVEQFCGDDDASSQRKWTSYISSNKCVRPRILQKQRRRRRKIIDSLQQWFDDSRVVVSHDHFRQSAQCLRTNIGLVRRTCSADLRSFVLQFGETCGEYEWRVGVSYLSQRHVNLNESSFDQCSGTNKRFENLPEDIRVSKAGDDAGFMRKISLGQYFMTIHDMDLTGFEHAGSCREWTSGWIRGITKNWHRIGSQGYVPPGSIWNWNQSWFHEESWITILDCDQQGNEQIRWRTSWREWEICSLRRSAHRYGATRCDKTEEKINSTITFTLNDGCTDRSTEVERHSCRPHRRQRILVIQCLKDNDPNSPTSRSSSRNRWSNGLGYIATYAVSRLRERPEMDEWWVVRSTA